VQRFRITASAARALTLFQAARVGGLFDSLGFAGAEQFADPDFFLCYTRDARRACENNSWDYSRVKYPGK